MKSLLPLMVITFACLNISWAQSSSYFSTLDSTLIETGLFYDQSPPVWRDYSKFNGDQNTPTIADFDDWRQLVSSIKRMEVVDLGIPTVEQITDLTDEYKDWEEVHLGVIDLEYNKLRPDAFSDTLVIEIDGTLHNNPNTSENPYDVETLLAVALDREWVYSDQVNFVFDPALFVSNVANNLEIDFGNGSGFQTLTAGSSYQINYNSQSDYTIQIRYFDGRKYKTAATSIKAGLSAIDRNNIDLEDLPDEIIELPGGSNAYIRYSCQKGSIKKPVILVEGLDIEPSGLTVDDEDGNSVIIRHGGLGWDILTIPEVTAQSNFPQLQLLPSLLNDFTDNGYDLVILDFKNGVGDLFDNGDELIALINEINQRKSLSSSQAENVIIGASMGGQVARIALSTMEQNGEDHDTRLFVSFDSPHQGAHIPVGIQHFLDFNGNNECADIDNEAAKFLFSILNSPAAQQLLITNIIPNADQVRENYVDELNILGYPQNCKNVAIASGSRTGANQGYTAGTHIVDFEVMIANILFHRQNIFAAGRNDNKVFEAKVPNEGIRIDLLCAILFVGAAIGAIFFPLIWQLITVVGFSVAFILCDSQIGGAVLPTSYCPEEIALTSPSHIAIDHVNGGFRKDFTLIKDELIDIAEQFEVEDEVVINHEQACFIPSVSALDLQVSDFNFSYSSVDAQEPGSITPFNEIFKGQEDNLAHVQVTTEIIDWVKEQMDKNDPDLETTPEGLITLNDEEYYNYGTSFNRFMNSFQVNNGGELKVNHPGATGFGQGPNVEEDKFVVYLGGGCHDPVSVVVENGGAFLIGHAGKSGEVYAAEGSLIHVKSGGILRVAHNSELFIETGSQLILEEGAIIQLWDGQMPDGRPAIRLSGSLSIGGEFDFSGTGYFDFQQGHELVFTGEPIFKLEGQEKGSRFIRVSNTIVDFEGIVVDLKDGEVEYNHGRIDITNGGRAVINAVEFNAQEGASGLGLFLDNPLAFTIKNSNFNDLAFGISITNLQALPVSDLAKIKDTEFNNCEIALSEYNSDVLYVEGCNFIAGEDSDRSMIFNNVSTVNVWQTEVRDYNSLVTGGNSNDAPSINLVDVQEFVFSNSNLHDCDKGIYAPLFDDNGEPNTTNVYIRKQSVLENNSIAIDMQNGGISEIGTDYGLLLVDCSKFLNNHIAVRGRDVLLQIDAFENSGTTDLAFLRSNHFQRGSDISSSLFDICYFIRDITVVNATGNYWGTDNGNPGIQLYNFYLGDCITGSGTILNTNNNIPFAPTTCPPAPPVIEDEPIRIDKKCEIVTDDGPVDNLYRLAYNNLDGLFDSSESLENIGLAKEQFAKVAMIPNSIRNQSTDVCKAYIDVARIMMPKGENSPSGNLSVNKINSEIDGSKTLLTEDIEVYPNPARDLLQINIPSGEYQIEIFNAIGERYFGRSTVENLEINIQHWPRGIYFMSISSLSTGRQLFNEKLIIQ